MSIDELYRGYRCRSANLESEYEKKTEVRMKLNLRCELELLSTDIVSNKEELPLSINNHLSVCFLSKVPG